MDKGVIRGGSEALNIAKVNRPQLQKNMANSCGLGGGVPCSLTTLGSVVCRVRFWGLFRKGNP